MFNFHGTNLVIRNSFGKLQFALNFHMYMIFVNPAPSWICAKINRLKNLIVIQYNTYISIFPFIMSPAWNWILNLDIEFYINVL